MYLILSDIVNKTNVIGFCCEMYVREWVSVSGIQLETYKYKRVVISHRHSGMKWNQRPKDKLVPVGKGNRVFSHVGVYSIFQNDTLRSRGKTGTICEIITAAWIIEF